MEENEVVSMLRKLIEELLNIHKSDIPESGRGGASQKTKLESEDEEIRINDNPNPGKGEE